MGEGARKARLSPKSHVIADIAVIGESDKSKVIEQAHRNADPKAGRVPEARYSYYRRCQLFRRNGEQCKAPAEKGAHICHAHAAQQAMALRREIERGVVLAEAVAEMRRRGKPECEMADLFTDFKGIQVTLAVVSRALIHGRIDCKTAGKLLVHLQTMSKLLATLQGKGKTSPLINTDNTDLIEHGKLVVMEERPPRAIHGEEPRVVAIERKIRAFPEEPRTVQHGKWEQTRAA
jgi:hypothetical protein